MTERNLGKLVKTNKDQRSPVSPEKRKRIDPIEQAKKCYAKAGLASDWQAVVADMRKRHFRKKGFMAGFEDIVAGAPKYIEPPFLERAKARWPRKSDSR